MEDEKRLAYVLAEVYAAQERFQKTIERTIQGEKLPTETVKTIVVDLNEAEKSLRIQAALTGNEALRNIADDIARPNTRLTGQIQKMELRQPSMAEWELTLPNKDLEDLNKIFLGTMKRTNTILAETQTTAGQLYANDTGDLETTDEPVYPEASDTGETETALPTPQPGKLPANPQQPEHLLGPRTDGTPPSTAGR